MLIRLEGDRLTTQLTRQPQFPIFAESETKFFSKVQAPPERKEVAVPAATLARYAAR